MGTRSFFVGIHKRVYDKLPRAGKAAVDKNSGLDFSMQLGTYYERDGTKLRTQSGSVLPSRSSHSWRRSNRRPGSSRS